MAITDAAMGAIRQLTLRHGRSAESGIRIAKRVNQRSLAASVTEGPEAGDQVIEGVGAPVYLDQLAVTIMDGKALDAQVDDNGAIVFTITDVADDRESGP
jgi:hypothetical protein